MSEPKPLSEEELEYVRSHYAYITRLFPDDDSIKIRRKNVDNLLATIVNRDKEIERLVKNNDVERCCEDFKTWQREQIDALRQRAEAAERKLAERDKRIAELEEQLDQAGLAGRLSVDADLQAEVAQLKRLVAAYRALRMSYNGEYKEVYDLIAQMDPLSYGEGEVRKANRNKQLAIARGEG